MGCAFATTISTMQRLVRIQRTAPFARCAPPRPWLCTHSQSEGTTSCVAAHRLFAAARPLDEAQCERKMRETLARIERHRFVLCIREDDEGAAYGAASAAIAGGIRSVEVTLTTPGAHRVMSRLYEQYAGDGVEIGAGTVMTPTHVDELADYVTFAMSPVCDNATVRRALARGILPIPGAMTPTEIWHAHAHAGAPLVKVFPAAAVGGPALARSVGGPMPQVPLIPTSTTVTSPPDASAYLRLPNVVAVGLSRQIVRADLVASADWAGITAAAKQWTSYSYEEEIE